MSATSAQTSTPLHAIRVDVKRHHFCGVIDTIMENVTECEALAYMNGPDSLHGTGGQTFDDIHRRGR